jgi:hypothetical protein
MTADPEVPAEQFARLMRGIFDQRTPGDETPEDVAAQERARLRRDVLGLLAGQAPSSSTTPTPPPQAPEPTPPSEPRDQFADLVRGRLGIPKEN